MLHNYSCPVARVMVCIGAAAVVRREPSGAKRRTARLLGLMMESLGLLACLLACLWNSACATLPLSLCLSMLYAVSLENVLSMRSLSLSFSRGHYSAGLRRILRYQLSTISSSPFEVTYHPLPVGLIPVKEQADGGSPCFVLRRVSFVWICSMGLRNFLRNSRISRRVYTRS